MINRLFSAKSVKSVDPILYFSVKQLWMRVDAAADGGVGRRGWMQ